jgi:hypothetical protein
LRICWTYRKKNFNRHDNQQFNRDAETVFRKVSTGLILAFGCAGE